MSLRILVISKHFSPEISPRAFRAFELARKLSETESVEVLSPQDFRATPDIRFKHIRWSAATSETLMALKTLPSKRKKLLARILHFILPGGLDSLMIRKIWRVRHQLRTEYDAVISVGLPIGVHIAAYILSKSYFRTNNLIFDYGDPFSRNPATHYSPLNKILERVLLRSARAVVVPVENAKTAFEGLLKLDKIAVIPQGLELSQFSLDPYIPHNPPRILYAGVFYENIRDPDLFMREVLSLEQPFELHLQTDMKQIANARLVEKYKSYDKHNRLQILPLVDRQTCISRMAGYDFLLNFANRSHVQNPSKLIDYAIAQRPVLDVQNDHLSVGHFKNFLTGNYSAQMSLPKKIEFDISATVEKFLRLLKFS